MKAYKGDSVSERLARAAAAKQAALKQFQSRPSADDPAVLARAEARRELIKAREERAAQRRAEQLAREAEAAAAEAERLAALQREAEAEAERQRELELERKVARDARYAARKARKK
jgi:hypothetical protein